MKTTYTIHHPLELIPAIGAATSTVELMHGTSGGEKTYQNLIRVYEPRRDCVYYVRRSEIFPQKSRTW